MKRLIEVAGVRSRMSLAYQVVDGRVTKDVLEYTMA